MVVLWPEMRNRRHLCTGQTAAAQAQQPEQPCITSKDFVLVIWAMQVDQDGSRCIEFKEFVRVIQINKQMSAKDADEADTLDAFVALGGNVS